MEIILQLMPWFWSAIFIAALIITFKTNDSDPIWFCISSLITLIITLIFPKLALIWQLLIFLSITIILLLTIARLIKKRLRKKNISLSSDALIGKEIKILEECNEFDRGSGIIDNVVWTVVCQAPCHLKKDDIAIIVAIEGNKLVVKSK